MSGVLTVGFALAATMCMGLAAWIAVNRRAVFNQGHLMLALVSTAIWAIARTWDEPTEALGFLLESARDTAWLGLLLSVTSFRISRKLKMACAILSGACLIAVPVVWSGGYQTTGLEVPELLLSRAGLVVSLVVLFLVEQVVRNASNPSDRSIRRIGIGIGIIYIYDLVMFSQAELLGSMVETTWNLRGYAVFIGGALIALGIRCQVVSSDLALSRGTVLYSTTTLAVGLYLSAMAIGGYYVRIWGGEWGGWAQLLFILGAGVVLASLLSSEEVQRRVKVWISKHLYRQKYDYRAEWLRFMQTLEETRARPIEGAIRAVAQAVASPRGCLFERNEDGSAYDYRGSWSRQGSKSQELPSLSGDEQILLFMASRTWIIDLRQWQVSRDSDPGLALPGWLSNSQGARLLVPVMHADQMRAVLLLDDPVGEFDLQYEDRDLLLTLGRHVAALLAQLEAESRLAENRQFEAYSRLSVFLLHDLKNCAATLRLFVSNASRHKHKPEFIDDAVSTVDSVARRISRIMEQLRHESDNPRRTVVDVETALQGVVARCSDRLPRPLLEATLAGLIHVDNEAFANALEHLVRNAQEATPATGSVRLQACNSGGWVTIAVVDTGCGMDASFVRERLFKPFDTTKGAAGMGIGAYQVKQFALQSGGHVEVCSTPGAGTRFCISLPESQISENRIG